MTQSTHYAWADGEFKTAFIGTDAEFAAFLSRRGLVAGSAPPEPTAEELLEAARQKAEIGRVPFLLAMVGLGVIDNDTALEASDGTWPTAFDPFLVPLTLEEKMTVKSAWRAADKVRLDSPVLATIAAYTQTEEAMVTVTQADLDTVFGVTP